MNWTNVTMKLSDLRPWERNPRQIKSDQAERLLESFSEFGQVETIAIGPDGEVYNGHQRLSVLLEQYGGEYEIECRQSFRALTEKEREKLTILLHKGAAGEWDWDTLANEFEIEDLVDWGFTEGELIGFEQEPSESPEPKIDEAEELREKWGVESGQLWQLGKHRVICGDCTDQSMVDKLMGENKAESMITDPPFGVRDNKWDIFETEKAFVDFTVAWMGNTNTDVLVTFMADKNVPLLRKAAEISKWEYRRALIWRKPPGSQFAGASLDGYWYDFEIIQVFGKAKFKPSKQTRMAVLEHRTIVNQEHGAEKPVELIEDLLWGYSQENKIVLDMFLGVGTTLVACEQLNRICYGVEIEPKYVAVTIERWHEMTGEKPITLHDLHH